MGKEFLYVITKEHARIKPIRKFILQEKIKVGVICAKNILNKRRKSSKEN